MSLYSFISDITSSENKAFRMGIVHLMSSLARPFAAPAGAWLLDKGVNLYTGSKTFIFEIKITFAGGFVCVTGTSLLGITLATLWLVLRLRTFKWQPPKTETNKRQLLSWKHVKDAIATTFMKRAKKQRLYILLLCGTMVFVNMPFGGEGGLSYNYVRIRYDWEVDQYSNYQSFDYALNVVG